MAVDPPLAAKSAGAGTYVNRALFILLIGASLVMFSPLMPRQDWQNTFATYFISIVLEAVPYILIGSLLAGLIELFLPATLLPRLTKRLGLLGIPATALVAPIFPACECGVLAVARGLLRKGLPLPHTVTYLLAGPIMNPTVLFTTWLAFQDARYPILRALGALFVAITVGLIIWRVDPRRILLPRISESLGKGDDHAHDHHGHGHDHQHGDACGDACHDHPAPVVNLGAALKQPGVAVASLPTPTPTAATPIAARRSLRQTMGQLSAHVIDHFLEMAAFFLMGVFIAAAMKTWYPTENLTLVATSVLLAPLAMMLMAFILSLCAEADAFVAASFTEFSRATLPMASPALLAFLVFGPMFDIKLLLMYRVVFRTWFIAAIALAMAVLVLVYVLALVPVLDQTLTGMGIGRGAL
ncbi:MAG: permease [Planctomycetes bacterium]|nr:permease [Planctomycetota bacterium]